MEEIKKILLDYKEHTISIIKLLEEDEFDGIQHEIKKRQCILDKLISFSGHKEECKKIYKDLEIEKLQSRAEMIMKKKSSEVKEKLEEISKNKRATNAYGRLVSGAAIFSKKI